MLAMLKLNQFETVLEQARAQMVSGITMLLLVLYTLYILFVPINTDGNTFLSVALSGSSDFAFYIVSFYMVCAATFYLIRSGQLALAAWGPILMWVFGAYINTMRSGMLTPIGGVTIIILVLFGGLLQSIRGLIVTTGGALVAAGIALVQRSGLSVDDTPSYITDIDELVASNVSEGATLFLMIVGIGGLIYLYIRYAAVNRDEGVTEAVENREVAAEVVTQIAAKVAQRVDLDALLDDVVNIVNQQFEKIYHTQVFLVNEETREAELVASTGRVGRQLLEREHSLRVGSNSVIGQVTLLGSPVVAHSGDDTVHRRNELLVETQAEAAIPLRIGERIVGALDVQSRERDAFDDVQVMRSLQVMADSMILAIDNVRQYDTAQTQLRENKRLVQEAREALREVERLNERLTGQVWSEYLSSQRDEHALSVDFDKDQVIPHAELTSTLQEAMQINHLVQDQKNNQQVIAVPLRVRGRVIGAMEFELDPDQKFTPDDFDLVQEVSERFGLAVENARLVDVSQRVAQRETLVNQISSRLQSTNNVEAMLNEAAKSLYSTLNAEKVTIQLGKPPQKTEG